MMSSIRSKINIQNERGKNLARSCQSLKISHKHLYINKKLIKFYSYIDQISGRWFFDAA